MLGERRTEGYLSCFLEINYKASRERSVTSISKFSLPTRPAFLKIWDLIAPMRRQIPEDQPSKGGWSGTEGAADLEIRSPGYGPSSALPQCMTLHSPVALTCKMKDGQDSPLEHSDLELMCQCGTGDPTEHPPVDSRSCFGASEKELCRAVKNRALRGFFFFSFLSFFRTSSQCVEDLH